METVCPLPIPWDRVYKALTCQWEHTGRKGRRPPTPLILEGWVSTNDVSKKRRWDEMIAWAEARGYQAIVRGLHEDEFYTVEVLSTYDIGPRGGPMYLPWDYSGRIKPSDSDLSEALKILQGRWRLMVGVELADVTRPLRFTGKKKRRLLVGVLTEATTAPWGTWSFRDWDESKRRTFTAFRSRINLAITPVFSDHIDFERLSPSG